ncbi:MAG: hypothetical protein HN700_19755, partial [Verrucomicrobia bacterium]|nr:hypothetical protein [Verrucomicrobiota bacterium]
MMAVFGMRMASSVANNGGAPTGMVGMMVVTYVVMMVVSIAFPLFYHTWMVGKYGATLGKMACRLVIVRSDQ